MHIRVLFILSLLAMASRAQAGIDASVWAKSSQGRTTVIPWLTLSVDDDLMFDLRYNFDAPGAGTLVVGFPLGGRKFSVTPGAGWIVDYAHANDQIGITGQVYVNGTTGRFSAFTMFQYASLARSDPDDSFRYSFRYHWGDWSYRLHRRLLVSLGEQVYRESGKDTFMDIGPAVKFLPGRGVYTRFWVTVDPSHHNRKAFVGLGYAK